MSIPNSCQRAPIAQVTVDDAQPIRLSFEQIGNTLSAILMTDTVKSIALDTLLIPGIRPRIDDALGEQITMKGGIKYCNLWCVPKQTLCGLNPFNVYRIVQWRKWRDLAQLL